MTQRLPAAPPWMNAGWADEAAAWAAAQLAPLGRRVTGAFEDVHNRIWSAVLRIPTDGGDVFLKGCGPAGAHEPALLAMLARVCPRWTPTVLAVDTHRAWVLQSDGGQRLRELIAHDHDLGHWRALLPLYAQAQIDLAERVEEMLSLGVPDDRLSTLAAHFALLLDDVDLLDLDQPAGLSCADHARLIGLVPQVRELCDELRACGIPQSLHHGDLHDGNVFVAPGAAGYTFFDWGDSCVTHPFFSLRVVEASVARTFGLSDDSGEWAAVRESYFEAWSRKFGRTAVETASALARRLAPIDGALRWHHVLSCVPRELRSPYREYIPQLLQDVLAGL